MRRSRLGTASLALVLGLAGCQTWYNDIPSPDDLMHVVPWFDAMIKQRSVAPYSRADVPRNTVDGTVPITGSEGSWLAEWSVGDTRTADQLANPLAGQGPSAMGDTLFHTYCAVCHGNLGGGDGPVAKKIGSPSLLTDRAKGYTDGYLYSIIRYGRGVMPRYGDKVYRPDRRWEIVNYVRKLQADAVVPAAAPGGTQ
jgi:mono/diheme cytochrome c family protein